LCVQPTKLFVPALHNAERLPAVVETVHAGGGVRGGLHRLESEIANALAVRASPDLGVLHGAEDLNIISIVHNTEQYYILMGIIISRIES